MTDGNPELKENNPLIIFNQFFMKQKIYKNDNSITNTQEKPIKQIPNEIDDYKKTAKFRSQSNNQNFENRSNTINVRKMGRNMNLRSGDHSKEVSPDQSLPQVKNINKSK
ncbi:hypothetical protein pb186bvf_000498 [Paramecium bursaria]